MAKEAKKLYRLPRDGKIFGVCAGLADYFDMDATLMRAIFVVMALAGGIGIPLYIILAIIMPASYGSKDKNKDESISDNMKSLKKDINDKRIVSRSRNYMGIGLIVVGLWLLVGQFVPELLNVKWDFVWPVILILIGVLVVARRSYER